MHKLLKSISIIVFILILLNPSYMAAQDNADYILREIITTATGTPVSFPNLSRSVSVITPKDISLAPVNSVPDLLKYTPGVDLRTRGYEGVQSDIGIRGGSFEETLILINGIKISDPQTGHHNLNLPFSLLAVDKIEILKGPGSRIYGANAFSGAVNIITREEKKTTLDVQITGGQNGLAGASLFNSYILGPFSSNVSFSRDKCDGYRPNTNFDNLNFFYNSAFEFSGSKINLMAGYNDKKFGANNFYSSLFPNQWEHTTTRIAALTGTIDLSKITLSPKVYWRKNDDDYILDNTRPDWYHNIHKTNSYTAELQANIANPIGATVLGGEFNYDKIESTNLGWHDRAKGGFFTEQNISSVSNVNASLGFYAYNYSSIGWKLWPGADISYLFSGNFKIYATIGRAFRIPTFTDLYYTSPASVGNPNLLPEETTNYEIGASYLGSSVHLTGSVFYKQGKNIIDWVQAPGSTIWTVQNETNLNTTGFETGIDIFPSNYFEGCPFTSLSINYTYLSQDREASNFKSEYALDHLRHQLIINIANDLFDLKQSWILRYEYRENFEDHFVTDMQIAYDFDYFLLTVKASNLFNSAYMDYNGIPMPGRWISASIKFSLK